MHLVIASDMVNRMLKLDQSDGVYSFWLCCESTEAVYCLTPSQAASSAFGPIVRGKKQLPVPLVRHSWSILAMCPAYLTDCWLHMWDSGGICVLVASSSSVIMLGYCLLRAGHAGQTCLYSLSCSAALRAHNSVPNITVEYTQTCLSLSHMDCMVAQSLYNIYIIILPYFVRWLCKNLSLERWSDACAVDLWRK